MADAKVLVDVACDRVVEPFKLKNLNYLQRKYQLREAGNW